VKILQIHNDYQQAGGERTAVAAQRSLLESRGHAVLPFSADNAEIEGYSAVEKALFFPRTVFSRPIYRRLRELVRRERPDVAHVHNVFPLLSPAVYRALRAEGVPIVQTVHNFRLLCPNALFYTQGAICERCKGGNMIHAVRFACYRDSRLLSALYAGTIMLHRGAGTFAAIDRFIALTGFAATKLVEGGIARPDRITVLGNFLPAPLPAPGPWDDRPASVLFLGRLSPEKGVDVLLEAMAACPELELKIAGDGPDLPRLQARAAELGLGNVAFLGFQERPARDALLREALALVLPSAWYEHFPMTVLEASAAATPLVASRLGGLPGLIDEGRTGWLFAPGDASDLAGRLRELAADRAGAAERGRNARRALEERWSADQHYAALMEVYAQVCGVAADTEAA
jgi:glycosyltransferase involved in cell wall biosynthesis